MSTEKDEFNFKEREGSTTSAEEIDLYSYHEHNAGRLIIDPAEAKIELGEAVAARLKLSEDGTKVLWPQPTESAKDPQNWSPRKKDLQLLIITLAAVVPDFDSGIGIACIFALAKEYKTTTGVINNLTSNWSIFLLGWGGLVAVMLIRRLGRLPILFWSQVLSLGFLIGCTFAPNLKTFAAMRCLTAFFGTAPQVTGLYTVTDLYPFHLQARKLNLWSMGFLISPFLSPFAFGFLVARTSWRWAYGIGSMYSLFVVILIAFFMEETMYDRNVRPVPEPSTTGLHYRLETVTGITGWHMQKYRTSWKDSILSPFRLIWRPHMLMLLIFEALFFGIGTIGVNVTLAVFLGTPAAEGGFGWSQYAVAASYATPMVSVLIGEVTGRYLNDYIMNLSIKRNKGVFEAESRLWATYAAILLFVGGFVLLGAAIQKHLHPVALVIGWGLSEIAVMIGTVAIYAYCSDAFPKHHGEISSLLNLTRVLGGFSVAYFQVPWAEKHGALQSFGCEAA
ncbi:MFS general substrate transporter [Crepidotus variabilis]|uniref:MFS general substrate transporter n=1 Tax=Crepidotus variabilis TaxID=179855 RepID=A0A9P6JIX9_9AGAR|nr:MFS general substrate transporter [Crepidotus variabilis]